jgi:hypothetical protein
MAQANQESTIKFGSNTFTADTDFTIIGLNNSGAVVLGATFASGNSVSLGRVQTRWRILER